MGKGCEMGLDMAASSTLVIPSPLNLLYFQPPKDQAGANHLCIISATPGFSSFKLTWKGQSKFSKSCTVTNILRKVKTKMLLHGICMY